MVTVKYSNVSYYKLSFFNEVWAFHLQRFVELGHTKNIWDSGSITKIFMVVFPSLEFQLQCNLIV